MRRVNRSRSLRSLTPYPSETPRRGPGSPGLSLITSLGAGEPGLRRVVNGVRSDERSEGAPNGMNGSEWRET